MFDGGGGMGWMMAWGWLVAILLIGLVVGLTVYAVTARRDEPSADPLAILRQRYARREIDQTDYDQRSRVLRGEPGARENPGP